MKVLLIKILKFISPIIIVILGFTYDKLVGLLLLLLLISYLAIKSRAKIYSWIGSFNYSKDRIDIAMKWFKKMYDSKGSDVTSKSLYGYLLLKHGNIDDAERILNDLLKKALNKEEKLNIYSNQALISWKKGNLNESIEIMENVIKDFKTSNVYGSLGYFYVLSGDLDKALSFNLEAYDYNSTNLIILDNLGETYYLRGEYDKSLEIFEKLIENPTFPEAYFNYAKLLIKMEKIDDAIRSMEKSLNCKFTFLSTLTKEDINIELEKIKKTYTGELDAEIKG